MSNESMPIDPRLWDSFSSVAVKQKKKPRTLLTQLIRDYLETQEDQALFAAMRRDLRGRAIDDTSSVEMVKRYRREKRPSRAGRKTH